MKLNGNNENCCQAKSILQSQLTLGCLYLLFDDLLSCDQHFVLASLFLWLSCFPLSRLRESLDTNSPQTHRYCNYESFSIPVVTFCVFISALIFLSGIKNGSGVPVANARPVSAGKTVARAIFALTSPSLEAATRRGRSVVYGSASGRRW